LIPCPKPPRTWQTDYKIERAAQDLHGFEQPITKCGCCAQQAGHLDSREITPCHDSSAKKGDPLVVDNVDEHPRTLPALKRWPNSSLIVRPDGTVTAGNASGVNDGSCAILILANEQTSASKQWLDA
jgi:acetyl-CoA acyltransferase